jgi:hypothetical protein
MSWTVFSSANQTKRPKTLTSSQSEKTEKLKEKLKRQHSKRNKFATQFINQNHFLLNNL